ncbi:MAG TPA: hypothetical protein VK906_08800 [Egicoccus sp.]|nr:hypothetical protein [Egicoccus sp.]HSK23260.1 hypothetical protein [Egicoccus sp.]
MRDDRPEETHVVKTAQAQGERDPFAPIEASPRFATPLAVLALVMAVLCVVSYAEAVAGPLGMALGLIAHVKGSRLGMPAAILAGVAMIAGMAITFFLR